MKKVDVTSEVIATGLGSRIINTFNEWHKDHTLALDDCTFELEKVSGNVRLRIGFLLGSIRHFNIQNIDVEMRTLTQSAGVSNADQIFILHTDELIPLLKASHTLEA